MISRMKSGVMAALAALSVATSGYGCECGCGCGCDRFDSCPCCRDCPVCTRDRANECNNAVVDAIFNSGGAVAAEVICVGSAATPAGPAVCFGAQMQAGRAVKSIADAILICK